MVSTQSEEKAMRDEARKQRLAALEEEKVKMQNLIDGALSRFDRWEAILSPILDSKGEVTLSKAKRKAIVNQMAPKLVEQLNALPADKQYEVFKELSSMDGLTIEEAESTTDFLQILQKHGFEKKF